MLAVSATCDMGRFYSPIPIFPPVALDCTYDILILRVHTALRRSQKGAAVSVCEGPLLPSSILLPILILKLTDSLTHARNDSKLKLFSLVVLLYVYKKVQVFFCSISLVFLFPEAQFHPLCTQLRYRVRKRDQHFITVNTACRKQCRFPPLCTLPVAEAARGKHADMWPLFAQRDKREYVVCVFSQYV